MEWYYVDASGGRQAVSADDLPGLVAAGRIGPATLVWNETMTAWAPAGAMIGNLFPSGPPQLSLAQRRAAMDPGSGLYPEQKVATDAVAVCALVFGILGLPICLPIFSVPAIICGHIAKRRAKEERTVSANAGLALAGLITGYIGLASMILILIIYVSVIIVAVVAEGQGGGGEIP